MAAILVAAMATVGIKI